MNTSHYRWLDYTLLTCAFFLIAHDLDAPRFLSDSSYYELYASHAGTGSANKQIGVVLLFLYGSLACLLTRKQVLDLKLPTVRLALAFSFLITISISWSAAPSASLVRWSAFMIYAIAAVGAVKRLTAADLVRWYVLAHCSYLLIGLLNEVSLGTFSPLSSGYRFSGISDPNATGTDALVLAFSSIAMLRIKPGSWVYKSTLTIALAFLALTRSRTALFATIFTVLIYYGIVSLRKTKLALYLCTLGMLVCVPFILNGMNLIDLNGYLSLGREQASDSTMTGRVPLWTELYTTDISAHPLLGYGYGGFWTPERSKMISRDQGWTISAAHSAYIDATLALGLLGLFLYLAVLFGVMARGIRAARHGQQEAFFFGCVVLAALLDGVADSAPWFNSSIYLFVCIQSLVVVSAPGAEFASAAVRNVPSLWRSASTTP